MTTAAALAVFVVYALAAFGWRSIRQLRRTGSTGFRGISGAPLSAEWTGGVLFVIAMVSFPVAAVLALLDVVAAAPMPAVVVAVGATLCGLGFAATLWSQIAMGDSWRVGVDKSEQTALVSSGPFNLVRNPIFSAMVVASLGFTILVPSVISIVGLVALVVAIELQVRLVEEPYLLRAHGSDYAGYAAAVGRFVPGLGRLSGRSL
jgi:protein-S-isoprenylcysteine O-methyltransferase Ste14